MSKRVLFVAALHHPEELQADMRSADAGEAAPLFPSSMGQRFWERAMRAAGYEVDVFWRNLPGYGARDIARLQTDVFREGLTPGKIAAGLLRRLAVATQSRLSPAQPVAAGSKRGAFDRSIVSGSPATTARSFLKTLAQLKRELDCKIIYVSGVSPIVFSHANRTRRGSFV